MTKEEILQCVSEAPKQDEMEDAIEDESGSKALTFSVTLCIALAIVKVFCFKENPYEILAIEFLVLAAESHNKWKRLHKSKDMISACVMWAVGITALTFYLIIAIGKRIIHE